MDLEPIITPDMADREMSGRFFNQLWESLKAEPLKNAHGIIEDLKTRGRFVSPIRMTGSVMKTMDEQDNRWILAKVQHVRFYSENLDDARGNCCSDGGEEPEDEDAERCCPEGAENIEVHFNHADIEVIGLSADRGELTVWGGHSLTVRTLRNDRNNCIVPSRILGLLSGDDIVDVDSDGETHILRLERKDP